MMVLNKVVEVSVSNYDFSVVCLEFGDNIAKIPLHQGCGVLLYTQKIEKDLAWQCHRAKPQLAKG